MKQYIEGQCFIWEPTRARTPKTIKKYHTSKLRETAQKAAESYLRKFGINPTHYSAKYGTAQISVKLGGKSVRLKRASSNQEHMVIVGRLV